MVRSDGDSGGLRSFIDVRRSLENENMYLFDDRPVNLRAERVAVRRLPAKGM